MNNIFNKLTEMSASFAGIKNNIDMQTQSSGQIVEALKKLRSMVDEVNKDSAKIKDDSSAIANTVTALTSASRDVSASVSAAQNASRQIADSFSMAKKIVDGKIIIKPVPQLDSRTTGTLNKSSSEKKKK